MEWITIKEVCKLTKKSDSTIRNLARKLKASNNKNIRLETLKTGHDKILFNLAYVNRELLTDKPIKNKQLNEDSNNDKMLSILERELNEKNKQIEALTERLKESNLLNAQLQDSIKMIEAPKKKKRWFGW
jgi:hypothetical protein